MKYKFKNGGIVKLQKAGIMPQVDNTMVAASPQEYKRSTIEQDHDALVKWNLEHPNDKVYRIEDLIQKEKEANPSWVERAGNLAVNPIPTSNFGMMSVPNPNSPIRSTVKDELGMAMTAATVPIIGSEIGIYGGLGTALRLSAGSAAAAGASYAGGKAGDWLDDKLGSNWIGDTNRLVLPFITFPAGMKGATNILRSAAGHGITMGIPQETFNTLKSSYFTNRFNKTNHLKVVPNKGWDNFSNLDVYKDTFYNHPAIEITEPATDVPNISGIKIGNPKDIVGLKVSPSSAMETGYIDFFDESKPFRKDLRRIYDIARDGTSYHFGHPLEEGVIHRTRDGYEFLEYPRGSNIRYYTGKIKTEGYTPTLVHEGEPNMDGHIQLPRPDPFKRNQEDYLWWQRNSPWVRYTRGKTVRINDVIPTKAAWGSDSTSPIRLSGAFDLSDPNLNATMMEYNPLTKTWAKVKYVEPNWADSLPDEKTLSLTRIPTYSGMRTTQSDFGTQVNRLISLARQRDPVYGGIKLIRNIDGLPFVENGKVRLVPQDNVVGNFTTDLPFRTHANYSIPPGTTYMIIDPNVMTGIKPASIEPMDTIFFNPDIPLVEPSKITLISGDPVILSEAEKLGFKTGTNDAIKNAWQAINAVETPKPKFAPGTRIQIEKGVEPTIPNKLLHANTELVSDYKDAIDRYITEIIGRPTLSDYRNLEQRTGLNAGVAPEIESFSQLIANYKLHHTPVRLLPSEFFTFPNGTTVNPHLFGNARKTPYSPKWFQHVYYQTTPTTEADLFTRWNTNPHRKLYDDTESWRVRFEKLFDDLNIKGFKQGGIIKGRNGFLNTWQKAYNSKFGKGFRNFMFGKDNDLSDEEYLEKYGYNKPVGGIGILGALVAPEWEGLEIPEITAQHIGNQGKVLRWFESGNSKISKVPIKEASKKTSNWQKFLKLSQQEQDDFVRRWNGESFQGFATLKGDKQALGKFRSWINSRK